MFRDIYWATAERRKRRKERGGGGDRYTIRCPKMMVDILLFSANSAKSNGPLEPRFHQRCSTIYKFRQHHVSFLPSPFHVCFPQMVPTISIAALVALPGVALAANLRSNNEIAQSQYATSAAPPTRHATTVVSSMYRQHRSSVKFHCCTGVGKNCATPRNCSLASLLRLSL